MSGPGTGLQAYPDESHLQGVWRVLPAEEFDAWLDAQSRVPASIRYIVDHHTYSPSYTVQDPAGFRQQVRNIFRNYYEPHLGWGRDRGPQLWLGVMGGRPWVVIATSMWVHGPHAAYFNGCSVGIETMWNGDARQWTGPIYEGLYLIHRAFEERLGIPLKRGVTGPIDTNVPTKTGTGWLFHRDAKNAHKTCPGRKNTHAALQAALDTYRREEDDMNDALARLSRISEVARSYDAEALKLLLKELIRVQGGDPGVADELEAQKAAAVKKERKRLEA